MIEKSALSFRAKRGHGKPRLRRLCGTLDHAFLSLIEVKLLFKSIFGVIHKHSRRVYVESGRPMACMVCGYDHHVDICHLKRPINFDDSATVAEVNSQDNLVALCRNHHHEQETGHRTMTHHWTSDHYDYFETSVVKW